MPSRLFEIMSERAEVFGAPIDPWSMVQAIEVVSHLVEEERFARLIGAYVGKLLQTCGDSEIDDFVRRCEVVNADDAFMVMPARWRTRRKRHSISFEEWANLDYRYIRQRSALSDSKLIVQAEGCVPTVQGN